MSDRDPPWFTPLLKHLIHQRWSAYRCRNFALYNTLRFRIKNLIVKCKLDWANRSSKSAKHLWNVVKSETSSCPGGFPSFLSGFTDSGTAANTINNSLGEVFVKNDTDLSSVYNELINTNEPRDFFIEPHSVFDAITKFDSNKSYGSDLIPIKLYQSVAHCICDILCHIFNDCIRTSTFPNIWKVAHVTCIPKFPNASISDIRPISLLFFRLRFWNVFCLTCILTRFLLTTAQTNSVFVPTLPLLAHSSIYMTSSLLILTTLTSAVSKRFATIFHALLIRFLTLSLSIVY